MAPRKTKKTKQKKTEPKRPPKSTRIFIKPLQSSNAINEMLGSDISDDSHLSNHSDDEMQHSAPQFSFLPSDRHSSPVVHAIASMSTVPNTEMPADTPTSGRQHSNVPADTPTSRRQQSNVPAAAAAPNRSRRKSKSPKQRKNLVIRDIYHYQNTTSLLIPKLPFSRLIREVLSDYTQQQLRVTVQMLMCLHEAAEIYIVQLLEDAARCAHHRGRVTVQVKDMHLAKELRREF